MRRVKVLLAVTVAAVGLFPTACNVFASLDRCSSDDQCPPEAYCDLYARFCIARSKGDTQPTPDAAAEAGVDASSDGSSDSSLGPLDASEAAAPPACDPTAPFATPGPLELDATVTSARFTQDELTVLYSASPPGCTAEWCPDLFFAQRGDAGSPFVPQGRIQGTDISVPTASEYWPTITEDEKVLYFESARSLTKVDGGYLDDQARIWTSTRPNTQVDLGVPFVQEVFKNPGGPEGAPYLHPLGHSLYFISGGRGGHGSLDIFVATITDLGGAQNITNIDAVNTAAAESAPVVSHDDLTLYFAREDAKLERRIWKSTRATPGGTFGAPTPITELASSDAFEEYPTWVSPDACRIYFVSNRPLPGDAGPAASRLWVAARAGTK
jgi:hypothetical protein